MSGEISLLMKAGVMGAGATAVSRFFGPASEFATIVLTDPVVLIESAAIVYLGLYLIKQCLRVSSTDSGSSAWALRGQANGTIFPVLTMNGVGALISEPKRSLKRQGSQSNTPLLDSSFLGAHR